MIGGQGEDSCGKSEMGEPRRKRRLARKSTALSQAIYTCSFVQFVRPLIWLCLNRFLVSESDQMKKKSLDKMASVKIR
ncbi:hypothetical protein ABEX78_04110 [Priestia megaterium]